MLVQTIDTALQRLEGLLTMVTQSSAIPPGRQLFMISNNPQHAIPATGPIRVAGASDPGAIGPPRRPAGQEELGVATTQRSSKAAFGAVPESESEPLKPQVDGGNDFIPPMIHVENRPLQHPEGCSGGSSGLLGHRGEPFAVRVRIDIEAGQLCA